MTSSCKLCHGPLVAPVPPSAAMQNSASRQGLQPISEIECHASCVPFACPSCVAHSKPIYAILNLKNTIDYACNECVSEAEKASQNKPVVVRWSSFSLPSGAHHAVC